MHTAYCYYALIQLCFAILQVHAITLVGKSKLKARECKLADLATLTDPPSLSFLKRAKQLYSKSQTSVLDLNVAAMNADVLLTLTELAFHQQQEQQLTLEIRRRCSSAAAVQEAGGQDDIR